MGELGRSNEDVKHGVGVVVDTKQRNTSRVNKRPFVVKVQRSIFRRSLD